MIREALICRNGAWNGHFVTENRNGWKFLSVNEKRFVQESIGFKLGETIAIRYKNKLGETSYRTITVQGFRPGKESNLIIGFCHNKQEQRYFAVDRLQLQ